MKKITICGVPASGKSTLANKIGSGLGIPVYHLDKISWKDGGVFASQEEIIGKVSEILEKSEWIIEGSLPRSKTFDMRIREADIIILLDVPIWLILWRQTKRFLMHYGTTRPDMGGNNKQKYPFTFKEVKYVLNYPTEELYQKILPFRGTKKVFIINNKKTEEAALKELLAYR